MRTTIFKFSMAMLATLFLFSCVGLSPSGWADDDDDDDDGSKRNRRGKVRWGFSMDDAVEPVDNALYAKECGACHLAFQPGLLPGRSWEVMLKNLEEHFGKDASLSEKAVSNLRVYLIQNAAETSRGETAYKILRSLRGSTPLRITETSYFVRKHDEVSSKTIKRKSIGTWANCTACHQTAEQGDYDDDNVTIPK